MPTLLLRLQGPMQSWGTRSRFDERDTALEPSKSGVLGLVSAALGRGRDEDISDLAALRMGVRVDREGALRYDYQTAQEVLRADGAGLQPTVQSRRYYLSDAAFLVGLEGPDRPLLEAVYQSLRAPRWTLFLGRKGYLPSAPVWLPDALVDAHLDEALRRYPPLVEDLPEVIRFVIESSSGRLCMDQPLAPFARRRFGARYVSSFTHRREEVGPCTSPSCA
ncbi:type I-E CRISPR-associated protein Cas5/CasD [Carboxydochorda subterranea]|uniref:Type I-E CRISPR-associated protein Cas5/CasD n=1 Tax=Carboxydichorda subterranea TaxID=3109565 RepID=A0ABZ1BV21_9FIRM|nr:type I-E CRISPR-associated protein Cas5/CasD [Limnochorda sp. L945t]WRP16340.1 type I-E CRISPR-associated protein Cas5/CasD [Limnochorda sp. L945t]